MSWYNTQGPDGDHVLFSKVRYIRNIAKQNFCHLIDAKRAGDVFSKLETILQKNGFRGEKLGTGATHALFSLAEKQFIDIDLIYSERQRALYLNEPCNLTVALGGENYITISSIVAGSSVDEAKNMASGAEELIDRETDLAYSESIGYLSPCISDCGSGMCFSAALYLPSLRNSDCFNMLRRDISKKGMYLEPMLRSSLGDIYILSYIPHYLSSENDASLFFSSTVSSVIQREKELLSSAYSDSLDTILNTAHRAMGAMIYSDVLSESELISYISDIRLCHALSRTSQASLPSIKDLNYLCAEGLNYSVITSSKQDCSSQDDCDRARARLVSAYIKHKNEAEVKNVK